MSSDPSNTFASSPPVLPFLVPKQDRKICVLPQNNNFTVPAQNRLIPGPVRID